jgi:hypothetical protein
MQQFVLVPVFIPETVKKLKRKNMKNLKYFAVVVLMTGLTISARGQFHRTVRGNHNVVKQERKISDFTGVKVSTAIDVFLTQGYKTSVVVETDENIQEYLVTEVNNNVLNIYFDASVLSAEVRRVYVTTREINSLSTTSAGDIFGQNPIKTENLKLNSSSAGDIKVEVYAKYIDANLSSSGDITLTGEADNMYAGLSSAGDLNAYTFMVKQVDINVSSAGNADIWVTEKLTARASSAGDINYKGDPEFVDAHSSSAGGIHKR